MHSNNVNDFCTYFFHFTLNLARSMVVTLYESREITLFKWVTKESIVECNLKWSVLYNYIVTSYSNTCERPPE